MRALFFFSLLSFFSLSLLAQKKTLQYEDFDQWKSISDMKISADGKYMLHQLKPGKGDAMLMVSTQDGKEIIQIPRGENARFTWDSRYLICMIKPEMDTVQALQRLKTKEDKMPKDSLAILDLRSGSLEKIARVRGYKIPEEFADLVLYQLEAEEVKPKTEQAEDSTAQKPSPAPKAKAVNKDNGYHLVLRNLQNKQNDTIHYVLGYDVAKKSGNFIYQSSGKDSTVFQGIYLYHWTDKKQMPLTRAKGKFHQLRMAEDGMQAAFIADLDTTKALIRDPQLRYWKQGSDSARLIAQTNSPGLPADWIVSEHGQVQFSRTGKRLMFGSSPHPIVQDTTLLKEEIIQVEVWSHVDSKLYTQQNADLEKDKKRTYTAVFDTQNNKITQIGSLEVPEVVMANHGDGEYALGRSNLPYERYVTWEGFPARYDLYSIRVSTGERTPILQDMRGYGDVSSTGKFIYWYNAEDTTWYSYQHSDKKIQALSKGIPHSMADELNDQPNFPSAYGIAGWTKDDKHVLIYDRYDIWQVDPASGKVLKNLTAGRNSKRVFRNINLDYDENFLDPAFLLLNVFDENDKSAGFASLKNLTKLDMLMMEAASISSTRKAKKSDQIIFRKGDYRQYNDLYTSKLDLKKPVRISDANPQQSDYNWGSVELYSWTSLDGLEMEGLLYKPEGFDPQQQYPMITYFYERNAENLHRHWGAVPIRSIINPSFYASRGYIVFIPDIVYREGYPGESCYNAVIPGVTSLIDRGFVDRKRVGVQGHSWGGYQTAYLITKTDLFACAEAGAIVANMISAYGGIRWETGLSRMFQYEHTQSRIGGTLWEYPVRYIENSPIFFADKVNTPLLLMHNDADGHVPWYQGIEFFMALRRLNKPVWMLNYNGEPHWPTKYENIKDFNIRMSQFFDHYLLGSPAPSWMHSGVPATEKGITSGY